MAAFVGLTVAVTLKQGSVIQGLVASVDPNTASLVLQDVYFPHTGLHVGNWTVQGHQIADLQVCDTSPPPPPAHHQHIHSQAQSHRLPIVSALRSEPSHSVPNIPSPQPPVDAYEDPAILSFGRQPTQIDVIQQQVQEAPSSPVKFTSGITASPSPSSNVSKGPKNMPKPSIEKPRGLVNNKNVFPRKRGKDAAATLKAPFSNLDINSAAEQEHLDVDESDEPTLHAENVRRVSINKTRTGKPMDDTPVLPHIADLKERRLKQKAKRNRHIGARAGIDQNDGEGDSPEVVRGTFGGKGWRQTPILQESQTMTKPRRSNAAPSADLRSVRLTRKQRMEQEAQNGWATEDAGDIQELPEFDFAENLSKFDKRSVFDQIRTEDTTADEDRLVSFNRTPARPGTYGGKNLHPTENVLESPMTGPRRASTAQNSDTDETFEFDSGRAIKKLTSRNSSKRPYKNGTSVAGDSGGQHKEPPRAVRGTRGGGNEGLRGSISASSTIPARFTPPESPSLSQTIPSAHFRIATTNRVCPTIMPAGMAAIEEVAESEFGLSAEMITESAGRGIAEVAMATLGTAPGKRVTRDETRTDTRPWAVILAGNHRAGARALAAARHLRERNIRTLTCIVGYERQNIELVPEVRRQAEILVKMGGTVRGWPDVQNNFRLEGHPEVVVDAFLAPGKTFDALGSEDQRAFLDYADWSNKSRGLKSITLSIDMPSGLNGSTGESSIGNPAGLESIHILADHVVCIGAPRIGLLRALQRAPFMLQSVKNGIAEAAEKMMRCQVWVVDVGVNRAWKQSGMANSKGVIFGRDWVVPLKLAEDSPGETKEGVIN
ncbi:hypothetical protein FKW77_005544 [Venturia effusa]|uniref:Enhancer of mRNA-decapping protein 3 n=1 Tax=Venturia effusa TaxID=50376 RepID=A0A517LK87_9PEZI|nr:hypothetical protein FKW77_005544 [Venturia effusa]